MCQTCIQAGNVPYAAFQALSCILFLMVSTGVCFDDMALQQHQTWQHHNSITTASQQVKQEYTGIVD